jgi:hypothetical protein
MSSELSARRGLIRQGDLLLVPIEDAMGLDRSYEPDGCRVNMWAVHEERV